MPSHFKPGWLLAPALAALIGCDPKPPAADAGPEICDNHIDDNGNGLIDCADPQCLHDPHCTTDLSACLTDCSNAICEGQSCGPACVCVGGHPMRIDDDGGAGGGSAGGGSAGGSAGGAAGGGSGGGAAGGGTGGGAACVIDGGIGTRSDGGIYETACSDGRDNDCNGLIDCADSNCNNRTCAPNGFRCSGISCACAGNGGTPENPETTCDDGSDNDCNGLTDCADSACNGRTCANYGFVCNGVACQCTGNGGAVQNPETSCTDGHDNDCNGLVDCADPNCWNTAGGTLCRHETNCSDGIDNDMNGLTDCNDPACFHVSCSTTLPAAVCCGPYPTTANSATCTDLATAANCGQCGMACRGGACVPVGDGGAGVPFSGQCTCPGGTSQCPNGLFCNSGAGRCSCGGDPANCGPTLAPLLDSLCIGNSPSYCAYQVP